MTSRSLAEQLSRLRCLLLDFDGPVCAVFAGHPAHVIAGELGQLAAGFGAVSTGSATGRDPVQFLRMLADGAAPEVVAIVADALRDAEVTAIASATPTPGIGDLLNAADERGVPVAVVSNNSTAAIRAYLDTHGLSARIAKIVAREDGLDPRRLKPDPHLVRVAVSALNVEPHHAVLVGDSPSDVRAGRAVGVHTIGYANRPGKRDALADADHLIDGLDELTAALRRL